MKLLIAGGGTGGHVFPAISVAREWLSRGKEREVVIVGTQRGIETKLVPGAGLPFATIRAAGLRGIGGTRFLRNAAMLLPSLLDSAALLRKHRCAAAFGVGGYASGPALLAAVMRGVPSVIFEPNAEPGLANRWLAPFAKRIATAYEVTAERWGAKAQLTGCPVRAEFFNLPPREPRTAERPLRLLITGGSQGALPINRAGIDAMDLLAARKERLSVVHQSGKRDYDAVRVAYARREFRAEVVPFLHNMAERFVQVDLIVCRAGAITVAEVAAAGRAALFIPFGAATDSHQLRNAQAMESAGAARLIPEPELTAERLAREILALLDQPQKLSEMEQRAHSLARPRATQEIVDLIEGVAKP